MPLIFFILSIALALCAKGEPSCYVGAVIFGAIGLFLMATPEYKEQSYFKNKYKKK